MEYRQNDSVLATLRHKKPCGTAVARLVHVRVEMTDLLPDPTGTIAEQVVGVDEETCIELCTDPKQARGKGTRDASGSRQRNKWVLLRTDSLDTYPLAYCDKCGKEFVPEDLLHRLEHLVRIGRPTGTV